MIRRRSPNKPAALCLLLLCATGALSTWFSAAGIMPELVTRYHLSEVDQSLLTSSVLLGYVAGTLVSAVFGLADRLDPRRFFSVSAVVAGGSNLLLLWLNPASPGAIACRFLTGATVAGIYPIGVKMAATWARNGSKNGTNDSADGGPRSDMGLLLGLLIGALTFGTAAPDLLDAFGGADWRVTIALTSGLAWTAAVLVEFVALGPNHGRMPPFNPRFALIAWHDRALRLANFAYYGHNWELFGMWAWLGAFIAASYQMTLGSRAEFWAPLSAFAAIGVGGAIGCVGGGLIADHIGRTRLTIWAMASSAACSLSIGFLFGDNPWLVLALAFVWGVTVIADSAQFSASIAELSEPEIVGTMLTVQTCVGFLITLGAVHLLPPLVHRVGWRYAFMPLALGPMLGIVAMLRLRRRPEALKLASGRR